MKSFLPPLLILGSASCIALLLFRQPSNEYDVRVINGLSNNSSMPMVVWCVSREVGDIGGRALQERDDYSWTVEPAIFHFFLWSSNRDEFVCTVKWDQRRKKFKAFDRRRDRDKCGARRWCLWLVKEDGIYFGNDGVHWIKDFPWI